MGLGRCFFFANCVRSFFPAKARTLGFPHETNGGPWDVLSFFLLWFWGVSDGDGFIRLWNNYVQFGWTTMTYGTFFGRFIKPRILPVTSEASKPLWSLSSTGPTGSLGLKRRLPAAEKGLPRASGERRWPDFWPRISSGTFSPGRRTTWGVSSKTASAQGLGKGVLVLQMEEYQRILGIVLASLTICFACCCLAICACCSYFCMHGVPQRDLAGRVSVLKHPKPYTMI